MTHLPEQKRSAEELAELRMRNAFGVRPPVQHIKSQALHPVVLAVLYLLSLTSAGLLLRAVYVPALACAAAVMLASLWIYWKKPRSRHHVTLTAIISLLVLVFGTVYYLEQLEASDYDAQGPIGY